MRVSCIPGDEAYRGGLFVGCRATVTLDGAPVQKCFTADEERGLVVVADLDEHNRLQLTHDKKDVRRKTLRGVVRIQFPPGCGLDISLGNQ
jgi:hypothetical protein